LGSNIIIWDGEGAKAFWETEIEMHKTDPDYLFLDKKNKLYRLHQDGFIWNFVKENLNTESVLSNDEIRAFSQCTSNPDVMYVINLDTAIKTINLSAGVPAWVALPFPDTGDIQLYDIIVDPANPDRVWTACSGYRSGQKVYYSNDGGSTWQNISGSIENVPIRCIEYIGGANAGLYIGTEIGMYFRGDIMSDWIPFANYLPNTIVFDIEIRDGYVYAGTHGRGIWRSSTYSICPPTLTLTPGNDPSNPFSPGTQYYHASETITSTRIINGGIGTEINYISGQLTDLLTGFESKAGNFFEVRVEGCPD
jgi:hypothetical protein